MELDLYFSDRGSIGILNAIKRATFGMKINTIDVTNPENLVNEADQTTGDGLVIATTCAEWHILSRLLLGSPHDRDTKSGARILIKHTPFAVTSDWFGNMTFSVKALAYDDSTQVHFRDAIRDRIIHKLVSIDPDDQPHQKSYDDSEWCTTTDIIRNVDTRKRKMNVYGKFNRYR